MAKCLRCGAGSEWLEGRVADDPVAIGYHERIQELESTLSQLEVERSMDRALIDAEQGRIKQLSSRLDRAAKLLEMIGQGMDAHGVLPWMRSQIEEWFKAGRGEHRCTVWNAEGICDICGINGRVVERQEIK